MKNKTKQWCPHCQENVPVTERITYRGEFTKGITEYCAKCGLTLAGHREPIKRRRNG